VNSPSVAQSGTSFSEGGDAGEEILTLAKTNSVDVAVTASGDGLELLSGDPPPDIVTLLKDAKTEIIARLQMERRMINHWVAAQLID
jgi:hypothetical protein